MERRKKLQHIAESVKRSCEKNNPEIRREAGMSAHIPASGGHIYDKKDGTNKIIQNGFYRAAKQILESGQLSLKGAVKSLAERFAGEETAVVFYHYGDGFFQRKLI